MPQSSTSFRTDPETLSSLDEIAKDMGRSRNWVLNKAIKDFIEYQQWFKKQVQEGLVAAANGEFASDEEINDLFNRFGG
ncbi:CopG family ribbon-helix-helix protein [Maridesulfovibrio salexigens]|uniref:Transcriptional regulator, CopG family n=1 Tax=Maridesulfovibrio salexigens (strain ATCC 14822 / DSM 2638 / NCIMB 8403 / VKM B-1763) TaxID=526222 RepID=C6BW38_MARSD|nr:ribbon-helix-helix protein, CopG family [Maridesulfovibrio salexigens]ACS80241.1 transcriptional regulator, CopG family [Maridesulfovibrio salexigens DSM 2638]